MYVNLRYRSIKILLLLLVVVLGVSCQMELNLVMFHLDCLFFITRVECLKAQSQNTVAKCTSTNSLLGKLWGEWVQSFGRNDFWERLGGQALHRPIITNAWPPIRSQKSLRSKLVPILPRVSEMGNAQICFSFSLFYFPEPTKEYQSQMDSSLLSTSKT